MRITAGVLGLVLLSGCAQPPAPPTIVEAHGIVRIDGAPLKKAEVRFVPTGDIGMDYIAKGVTDEAGRFTLTCKGQPGACVGAQRVLVTETDFPPNLRRESAQAELVKYLERLGNRPIPPRYANLVESPLLVLVTPGQKEYTIVLTAK